MDEHTVGENRILHNYGHGAGGVSLAPGYANYRVNEFVSRYGNMQKNSNTPIGIIGSGYMGLFTALELVAKGFKVHDHYSLLIIFGSLIDLSGIFITFR